MSVTINATTTSASDITIPPPPDPIAENKLLRYRVYAAEMVANTVVTKLQEILDSFGKPLLKQLWAINEKYPLGDDTEAGVRTLAINAARAANSDTATMTDDQVAAKYLGGMGGGTDSTQGK